MMRPLSERVIERIGRAESLHHRLVLVVGAPGSGKTGALREVAARTGAPLLNINLEISRRLLDIAGRRRALQVRRVFDEVSAEVGDDILLLDNIELLFDPTLRQDPLRLLRGLSRHRTVAASWSGSVEGGHIRYAAPGHPEYRRHPLDDVLVVGAETPA